MLAALVVVFAVHDGCCLICCSCWVLLWMMAVVLLLTFVAVFAAPVDVALLLLSLMVAVVG